MSSAELEKKRKAQRPNRSTCDSKSCYSAFPTSTGRRRFTKVSGGGSTSTSPGGDFRGVQVTPLQLGSLDNFGEGNRFGEVARRGAKLFARS